MYIICSVCIFYRCFYIGVIKMISFIEFFSWVRSCFKAEVYIFTSVNIFRIFCIVLFSRKIFLVCLIEGVYYVKILVFGNLLI